MTIRDSKNHNDANNDLSPMARAKMDQYANFMIRMIETDISFFEYLIVMADGDLLKKICIEAMQIGVKDSAIVPFKVMALPGFDFEKYTKIRDRIPTIFAPSCWGGLTYNSLGLEFKSLFINMFENHGDYLSINVI